MRNKVSLAFSLIFSCEAILATGIGNRGAIGGSYITDDPFMKCPGASEFVGFSPDGTGVFLNDISRGKVKKIPKGISYKKLSPVEDGETRELYEVKEPSFPIGQYVFTKDSQGKVLHVEVVSPKKDKDLQREAELLLESALQDSATRIKVPTHRKLVFNHTEEGCKLSSSNLILKVFPIENNKLGKSEYSTEETEYSEIFCDKFNEIKNKKPDLMKRILECSFSGSDLLSEARGMLENVREETGITKAPPWTPPTTFNNDLMTNIRLGTKSVDDTVALSTLPSPSSVIRSMTDLNTLCDEKFSMMHSSNVRVSERLRKKASQPNTDSSSNSLSK